MRDTGMRSERKSLKYFSAWLAVSDHCIMDTMRISTLTGQVSRLILTGFLFVPALRVTATGDDYLSDAELDVIKEMNLARTDPKGYAKYVMEYRSTHAGGKSFKTDDGILDTNEGLKAVDEAIKYLEKAAAIPALIPSKPLSLAAKSHASDIGPKGMTSHEGSNGSTIETRISKQGKWKKTIGENLAFCEGSARSIVIMFIIDDGVSGRGHRGNIFNVDFKLAGVATAPHKDYGKCWVIDYAGGMQEGGGQ